MHTQSCLPCYTPNSCWMSAPFTPPFGRPLPLHFSPALSLHCPPSSSLPPSLRPSLAAAYPCRSTADVTTHQLEEQQGRRREETVWEERRSLLHLHIWQRNTPTGGRFIKSYMIKMTDLATSLWLWYDFKLLFLLLHTVKALEVVPSVSYHYKFCPYAFMRAYRYMSCLCLALCVCVIMSMALGGGTGRCVSLSACPQSSPQGPHIDCLAWPNRGRGAQPGKVNMEKKRHILSCPVRQVGER